MDGRKNSPNPAPILKTSKTGNPSKQKTSQIRNRYVETESHHQPTHSRLEISRHTHKKSKGSEPATHNIFSVVITPACDDGFSRVAGVPLTDRNRNGH
jgi:hypothetical protein